MTTVSAAPVPSLGRSVAWWMRIASCAVFACIADVAQALDVVVVGLFSGRAVVMINGGAPRTLNPGQSTPEGVRLVRADTESAELEIEGKRQVLRLGGGRYGGGSASESPSAKLYADGVGHFVSDGSINGTNVRFLVDTGATSVAMNSRDAARLGISFRGGPREPVSTANGTIVVYRVKLDTMRVGGIELHNVAAVVHDGDHPTLVLLGMSFLNRVDMRRDGTLLTLTQRY
jgi:aspartyl protease family protein